MCVAIPTCHQIDTSFSSQQKPAIMSEDWRIYTRTVYKIGHAEKLETSHNIYIQKVVWGLISC